MTRTDIDHLSDADVGQYRVVTAKSVYTLDLDADPDRRTITRFSDRPKRGDEGVVLVTIERCQMGEGAVWWLFDIGCRMTTTVLSIEEIQ